MLKFNESIDLLITIVGHGVASKIIAIIFISPWHGFAFDDSSVAR
ncbi:MAG: hypothetical protein ACTSWN_11300 [Promethearchaeota archaeon]